MKVLGFMQFKNKGVITDIQSNSVILEIKILDKFYIKENGKRIPMYSITDGNITRNVTSDILKAKVRQNKVKCINAILTSDNRLIVDYD